MATTIRTHLYVKKSPPLRALPNASPVARQMWLRHSANRLWEFALLVCHFYSFIVRPSTLVSSHQCSFQLVGDYKCRLRSSDSRHCSTRLAVLRTTPWQSLCWSTNLQLIAIFCRHLWTLQATTQRAFVRLKLRCLVTVLFLASCVTVAVLGKIFGGLAPHHLGGNNG